PIKLRLVKYRSYPSPFSHAAKAARQLPSRGAFFVPHPCRARIPLGEQPWCRIRGALQGSLFTTSKTNGSFSARKSRLV
ncbi:MAG: hypothetical protein IJ598_02860, partial [Ruminococcus sp.]|nr:hypothetical protein [Ruminococcus sp.]